MKNKNADTSSTLLFDTFTEFQDFAAALVEDDIFSLSEDRGTRFIVAGRELVLEPLRHAGGAACADDAEAFIFHDTAGEGLCAGCLQVVEWEQMAEGDTRIFPADWSRRDQERWWSNAIDAERAWEEEESRHSEEQQLPKERGRCPCCGEHLLVCECGEPDDDERV